MEERKLKKKFLYLDKFQYYVDNKEKEMQNFKKQLKITRIIVFILVLSSILLWFK